MTFAFDDRDDNLLALAAREFEPIDTGQQPDTGQLADDNRHGAAADDIVALSSLLDASGGDAALVVTFHEIHRMDPAEDGGKELITSTLKYFSLHLAVQNAAGELLFDYDGSQLVATLVYDDGRDVEDLSATLEPPLLAAAGECPPKAVIEGGCATLRLRITVLSSLCNKHLFRVRVSAPVLPQLEAVTAAVKTITKLHRGVRLPKAAEPAATKPQRAPAALLERNARDDEQGVAAGAAAFAKQTCGSKRTLTVAAGGGFDCGALCVPKACRELSNESIVDLEQLKAAAALDGATSLSACTVAELWEAVACNGSRLLALQKQQRILFSELRALKAAH